MGNKRAYYVVLRDMADECQKELTEIIREDEAGRGYSEGAREELTLRIAALREASEKLCLETAQGA